MWHRAVPPAPQPRLTTQLLVPERLCSAYDGHDDPRAPLRVGRRKRRRAGSTAPLALGIGRGPARSPDARAPHTCSVLGLMTSYGRRLSTAWTLSITTSMISAASSRVARDRRGEYHSTRTARPASFSPEHWAGLLRAAGDGFAQRLVFRCDHMARLPSEHRAQTMPTWGTLLRRSRRMKQCRVPMNDDVNMANSPSSGWPLEASPRCREAFSGPRWPAVLAREQRSDRSVQVGQRCSGGRLGL